MQDITSVRVTTLVKYSHGDKEQYKNLCHTTLHWYSWDTHTHRKLDIHPPWKHLTSLKQTFRQLQRQWPQCGYKITYIFQTCITFFPLLSTKEDILKNKPNSFQSPLTSIAFLFFILGKSMATVSCLLHILQNIFLYLARIKYLIQVWNNILLVFLIWLIFKTTTTTTKKMYLFCLSKLLSQSSCVNSYVATFPASNDMWGPDGGFIGGKCGPNYGLAPGIHIGTSRGSPDVLKVGPVRVLHGS